MYAKIEGKTLIIKKSPLDNGTVLSIENFSNIYGIYAFPEDNSVLLTGVRTGKRPPSLETNFKGELELYKARLDIEQWERINKGYAYDAHAIKNKLMIAFHHGNGITVIDNLGNILYKFKSGKFNWGSPSVSTSPDGNKIAFIKWKGDHKKICVINLADKTLQQYKPNCFSYSWFDENHIIYELCGLIKILDINTEETKLFTNSLMKFNDSIIKSTELTSILKNNSIIHSYFDNIKCIDNTIYFTCYVSSPDGDPSCNKYHGIFRTNKTKQYLEEIQSFPQGVFWGRVKFGVDSCGNIVANVIQKIKDSNTQLKVTIGPDAEFLKDGWNILEPGEFPDFGFQSSYQVV
jgi:hypothetical protein